MTRLVLLGGGHAHVHVLRDFARRRPRGLKVMLVSPFERQLYSGMLPGFVAGHYAIDEIAIPLAPLAQAAGVDFVRAAAVGLDAEARTVRLDDGRVARYDLLSLDVGSAPPRELMPGAREHAAFVRPIEHFVQRLDGLVALAHSRALDVVVIGGGAAGFELVLALQHRLVREGEERTRFSLVTGGPPPLAAYPAAVVRRGQRALARHRVTVFDDACVAVEARHVVLARGARLACDLAVVAIGGAPPGWLAASGLQLCTGGFVATGPTLQSLSHPQVFAVGDVCTRLDAPHPRSGVYAVRAGPPLAANLRRAAEGRSLRVHRPQARTLNLLSCGERYAIASWNGWSTEGAWVWRWKDRIDRGFIARYARG